MKRILISCAVLFSTAFIAVTVFYSYFNTTAEKDFPYDGDEPDMPAFLKNKGDKEEFMMRRAEQIGLKRGVDKNKPLPNPKLRQTAIAKMERQQEALAKMPESFEKNSLMAAWTPIGPAPIPNGQVSGAVATPVSGRVTAIAVHPTNPNIVYVGTAQGGLYRTTNGGTNWTPMMDKAMSLSIGAVTIDTGQPETVYVGTGEGNFSSDSFFGVGIYRIDDASSASPIINGPFNIDDRDPHGDIFTGRSVSKIVVYEFLPGQIYVATTSGLGGIGGNTQGVTLPPRGIWRSTNITSANPTFRQIGIFATGGGIDFDVRDIILDPLNADFMVAAVTDNSGRGGLYTSRDHRAPNNIQGFSQKLTFNGNVNQTNTELAIHHTVATAPPTIYAATGNGGGRVLRSTDFGDTWTQQIVNNFCGGQCFYDIAIAVDPTNANRVYLGGAPTSTTFPNSLTFGISTNGGTSFTRSENGVHPDTHVIAVARSQPSIVYLGTDGGIYKSTDSGATWVSLNNEQFSATQFMSIAVHPTDANFTLGGTQDNGTNLYLPNGAWRRADTGDGGAVLIDDPTFILNDNTSALGTDSVRMYHTYFSNGGFQGYATVPSTDQARDGSWIFRGCQSAGATGNGITCNGSVNFYAPLAQGPGVSTVYYGTDRLYRSDNGGLTNTVVSQNPISAGVPISAIGIAPQNDNVRIVGMNDGGIWGTTTGANILTNLDSANVVPNNYIARAVVAPNNVNTAYVTLSGFGVANVWRTTNLNNANPTWTAVAGSGTTALPRVPVNAFLIDRANSNTLYAGTDIGVFISTNGGAAWSPFGEGLPRVAVFDMAMTGDRKLRIATHGRGMWQMTLDSTAPQPRISIGDVSLNEGNSGTTAFNFTVSLSTASSQAVTVNFATSDGSATAASGDYASRTGTVTFNPNETSKTVTILVNGDTTVEPNENFNVNLSGASSNAVISDGQGVGTIINDDTQISINDISLSEGNSGAKPFTFNVTLSAAAAQTVTVNYATADGTATVGNNDYTAISGTLTFNPNETSKTITVQVKGDTTIEPNENFSVNLSGAVNATIADNQGIGTILNDDSTLPNISINDVTLNEGNSGTTAFTFTVNLSPAVAQPVTVNYGTANGTAVAPGDYISVPATTLLTFGAGETSKQISVFVIGDTAIEPNENFTVNLANPSNAVISDNQGVGTIVNDDGCSYAINPRSQNFPASGGSNNVQVTAQSGCAWNAASNSLTDSLSWLKNQNAPSQNIDFIASLTANIDGLFSQNSTTAVFNNTTPITIPDSGTAAPYPSNITVSGMTGTISDLNVRINNLSHSYPDDIAFLLVSPNGTKKFILQSDSGGGDDLVNLTYTYDDQAANGISDEGPMPVNNGSVRPSSVGDDDAMPAPAPATPYSQPPSAGTATLNGTFGGINPNGTWQLFVIDFFAGDGGSIGGGWSLDITTQGGASNWITITSGQNGSGNGTVSYSVAQNTTGQPRTGTMTIAGQTFTVNQSNVQRRTAFDFDGDGKADQAVFRPTNSAWYLLGSTSGFSGVQFGIPTDRIAPADFDGDGRTDIAVFRDGFWYWLNSSNGSFSGVQFGIPGDVPVPADYTGDGRAEIAVYRSGIWYTLNLANNQFQGMQFGIASDKPVPADFDGDGKTDLAVFRDGVWYHSRSSDNGFQGVQFGVASDNPVVGDYDGDGKADQAVFRSGVWYVLGSAQGFYGIQFGISSDVPVAADYDGDAKTDVAVFRDGNWYLQRSQEGFTGLQFGISIDKPIPAAFVP